MSYHLLVPLSSLPYLSFIVSHYTCNFFMACCKEVTKPQAEETKEIFPTVEEAVLSPVNQDTVTLPLPTESETMEHKEMALSDEEKEKNLAEDDKPEEEASPFDEEAAHDTSLDAAFGTTHDHHDFAEEDDEEDED